MLSALAILLASVGFLQAFAIYSVMNSPEYVKIRGRLGILCVILIVGAMSAIRLI